MPKPRMHLSRFPEVFAPNSQYRARVTPVERASEVSASGRKCEYRPQDGNVRCIVAAHWLPGHDMLLALGHVLKGDLNPTSLSAANR